MRGTAWTKEEEAHLRAGVERFGVGKWVDILDWVEYSFNECRTNVSLKDKWRTMNNGQQQPRQHFTRAAANIKKEKKLRKPVPWSVKVNIMYKQRYTCALKYDVCGAPKVGTLMPECEIHHIDGNPANNEEDNLQAVCGSCHNRHHHKTARARGR